MIDSHCHLDFEELNKDLKKILNNAKNQNVLGMQTICTKIKEFDKLINISSKHNNFFLNNGNATSSDIETLIEKVKKEVFLKTGTKLELEIKIVGGK